MSSVLKICIWLCLLSTGMLYPLGAQGHHRVQTVVIDPGHGGKDPGCHGAISKEKDICLAIGLQLGALIEEYFPDVKVVYTRKKDEFVELHRRAEIANKARADLFICIHVNAASPSAYGAETYVMGLHRTRDNLNVAKRENAVVSLEEDFKKHYEGFDPNSEEDNILIAMMQSAYLIQSLEFAGRVQQRFVSHAGRHDRGVRQAGFLVLVRTTMPAVLIETGFASHAEEEKFLASKDGQRKMAESIFMAFADYKKSREGKSFAGIAKAFPLLGPGYFRGEPGFSSVPETPASSLNANQSTATNVNDIYFSVQCMSTRKVLPANDPQLRKIPEAFYVEGSDGFVRYYSGKIRETEAAENHLQMVRNIGFESAFLVAFRGDEKISLQEAKSLIGKKD